MGWRGCWSCRCLRGRWPLQRKAEISACITARCLQKCCHQRCAKLCHAGLCAMQGQSPLTSVLGSVGATGRVVLPQPLHHILDPPDLLLDLPVEHFILWREKGRGQSGPCCHQPHTQPCTSHPGCIPATGPGVFSCNRHSPGGAEPSHPQLESHRELQAGVELVEPPSPMQPLINTRGKVPLSASVCC